MGASSSSTRAAPCRMTGERSGSMLRLVLNPPFVTRSSIPRTSPRRAISRSLTRSRSLCCGGGTSRSCTRVATSSPRTSGKSSRGPAHARILGRSRAGSPGSAVLEQLDVRVKKVNLRGRNPAAAIEHYVAEHDVDLLVLATEGRDGSRPGTSPRLPSASPARRVMTLFVPGDGRASRRSAQRSDPPLAHPGSGGEGAERAVGDRLCGAKGRAGRRSRRDRAAPYRRRRAGAVEQPSCRGSRYRAEQRRGEVIDEIERAARELEVDLIAMGADGRDGLLGAIGRGSHTEQRRAPRAVPVLAVPVGKT